MIVKRMALKAGSAAGWTREGDAARDRGDWPASAAAYEKALELQPLLGHIWIQYGHALKESGELDKAHIAYRRGVEILPTSSDAYIQLGHILKLKNDPLRATIAYRQAVILDPDNDNALRELRTAEWTDAEIMETTCSQEVGRKCPPTRSDFTRLVSKSFIKFDAQNYRDQFPDVSFLIDLGVIYSPEQHYLHYGYRGGRDILLSLEQKAPSRAFVLCPSFFKRCGIGEHARYLAHSIEASGLETHRIRTTVELEQFSPAILQDAILIINHGPGLFDAYNPELSEGESVSDVISKSIDVFDKYNTRTVVLMHSLLDRDNREMFPRQQLWLESPLPIVTTIQAAATFFNLIHIEHGMQPVEVPPAVPKAKNSRDYPTIGFFGFFQWGGKNFDALFNAVERLKGKLVGSVATGKEYDIEKLRETLKERGINCDLGTGWVDDSELTRRLSEADYFYLPQYDYDHWNNSGTARLVMNFRLPVVLPPHNPFLDLRKYAIFADEADVPAIMSWMRIPKIYEDAATRSERYAKAHPMLVEMPKLAHGLKQVVAASGADVFLDPNLFSVWSLLSVSSDVFLKRVSFRTSDDDLDFQSTDPDSDERLEQILALRAHYPHLFGLIFNVVQPVHYWRDHYDLDSFFFPTWGETITNVCRVMYKNEPNFSYVNKILSLLGVELQGINDAISPSQTLSLLRWHMFREPNLDFAPCVQIYHAGSPLALDNLSSSDLLATFEETTTRRLALCKKVHISNEPLFCPENDRNLLKLLTLPTEWVDRALTECARSAGKDFVFEGVGEIQDIYLRYNKLLYSLSGKDVRVSDIGLLDRPIVDSVNFHRFVYSIADFWHFDGDGLIFQVVRCLLKRDPSPREMFALSQIYDQKGRLAVIQCVAAYPYISTRVVDLNADHLVMKLDEMRKATEVLVGQVRSPYAGGWDLRNKYLEDRRNFDRAWLRMKNIKDLWWSQSGGSIDSIVSLNVHS